MGRTKATLPLGDRTFLERVTAALSAGGCEQVVVVFDPTDPGVTAEARRLSDERGVWMIENPAPGEGPITSMRCALRQMPADIDGIAWLPLDYTLVEASAVSRLLASADESGADLTLPVHGTKRGHPALFRRALFPELLDPTLEGGARIVVHRHLDDACLVPFEERGVVVDVDTPEAYDALLAGHAR
jgi:molybdenum cofactor cytidylyltransferase